MAVTPEVIFPQGPSFFVATNGNDANPGTILAPFLTLGKGVSVLTPGATLFVRGGTYAEILTDAIPSGTSATSQVTVSAYQQEVAIIRPASGAHAIFMSQTATNTWIVLKNLTIDGRNITGDSVVRLDFTGNTLTTHITFNGCDISSVGNSAPSGIFITGPQQGSGANLNDTFHTITNCRIHHCGIGNSGLRHGIYCESSHNTITFNQLDHNGGNGCQIYRSTTVNGYDASNNLFDSNNSHDNDQDGTSNGGSGISVMGRLNQISNNLFWNNGTGIQTGGSAGVMADQTKIWFNTCYHNTSAHGSGGIATGDYGGGAATNEDIRNNISYSNSVKDYADGGSGFASTGQTNDYNLTGDATAVGAHSLPSTNPSFVNAAAANFLLSAGSPAIGAGIAISQVPTDYLGVSRANPPSIGAYEYPT